MTFISYSQNSEDVLLWRALGHVKGGFYIDVGANDPVEHSVTKAFYDAGWSGINIEPLPHFHEVFEQQRPRDTNLAIAAGAREDSLTLFDVPSVHGWASPDPKVADAHRSHGFEVAELTVPMRPLAAVCAEHVRGEIHFLKIDVEGFEGEVLRGMDFARWRPWVLVIEATLPNSRVTNHETWEQLVTSQRYRFAWFDGLNRYYVAEEHAELAAALSIQPNVFDEFISWHLDKAWAASKEVTQKLRESEAHAALVAVEAHEAHERAELADSHRHEAEAHLHAAEAALAQANINAQRTAEWARSLEQELIATRNSTSWKVTRPLRSVGALLHALRRPGNARRLIVRITSNQRLRRLLVPLLLRYPALGRRVSASLAALKQAAPPPNPGGIAVPEELRALPVSVRAVLADLQRARSNQTGS
jgi:FkbM family methyltransferase